MAHLSRLIVAAVVAAVVAAAAPVDLLFTKANPLSGGLDGCSTLTAATCVGGAAAVGARMRAASAATAGLSQLLFVPVDRSSQFVQLHPDNWGANYGLWGRFNATAMLPSGSLFSPTHADVALALNGRHKAIASAAGRHVPMVFDSAQFEPTDYRSTLVTGHHIDHATGVSVVAFHGVYNGFAAAAAQVARGLRAIEENAAALGVGPASDAAVVVAFEQTPADCLAAIVAAGGPRPAVIVQWEAAAGKTHAPVLVNGTWLVAVTTAATTMYRLRITPAAATTTAPSTMKVAAVTVTSETLNDLPAAMTTGDPAWVADQTALVAEAAVANGRNVVLGRIAGPLAAAVTAAEPLVCVNRECEAGNMWADSMRWVAGADVGIISARVMRNGQWPAGNLTLRDFYSSYGFTNQVMRATLLGLTFVHIFNESVANNHFDSTLAYSSHDTQLLQVSGVRITVDPSRPRPDRLRKLEVLDRATGQYAAVDRLKTYTLALNSFNTFAWAPYNSLVARGLRGEVKPAVLPGVDMHRNLGAYLRHMDGTYTPALHGRIVKVADATDASGAGYMTWHHSMATCAANEGYDPAVSSCVACPPGQVAAGGRCSDPAPPSSSSSVSKALLFGVIGGAVAIVAIVGSLLAWRVLAAPQQRDLRHAPKDGREAFTIVFTDIQASTALWSRVPAAMSAAVEQHHATIRKAIAARQGYEVKTIGDAFMVAFRCPKAALQFALDVQLHLLDNDVDESVDEEYAVIARERCVSTTTAECADTTLWDGLRVRIGVHTGTGRIVHDEVTGGYDYYGTVVNTAARVEAVGHGGQVLVTDDALAAATGCDGPRHGSGDDFQVPGAVASFLGAQSLRGLDSDVSLWQLLPQSVAGRRFPPLLLEKAAAVRTFDSEAPSDGGLADLGFSPLEADTTTGESEPAVGRHNRPSVSAVKAQSKSDAQASMLLSPLKAADRVATVAALASAWRVSFEAKKLKTAATAAATLARVLKKAGNAQRMKTQRMSTSAGTSHSEPPEVQYLKALSDGNATTSDIGVA